MPDFFTFIPDNYRNQTDFSRDKADFQHIQMDKTPLDADWIIRTFTLKSPCPYDKKQKLSVALAKLPTLQSGSWHREAVIA